MATARDRSAGSSPPPPPTAKALEALKIESPPEFKNVADFTLKNAEDVKVSEGLTGAELAKFVATVRDIIELNGSGDVAGIQSSYIEVKQYVQVFDDVPVSEEMKKVMFMAFNWEALGRGTGGLAGASVRWSLKQHFSADRETVRHRAIPKGAKGLIEAYGDAARNQAHLVNFFITNAVSIAALAGAMVNKIVHHWDAQHTGAQKAFLSAMGMGDLLQEEQYRAVFYLAIHPLPLLVTERLRNDAATGRNPDVAEVVRLRCVGPPAGYGAMNACAAAASSFLNEQMFNESTYVDKELVDPIDDNKAPEFYANINREIVEHNRLMEARREKVHRIRKSVIDLVLANRVLIENAPAYHQFATKYGYTARLTIDQSQHEAAMVMLTAYIMARIKGSLAGSAAVKKFRNTHAREVTKRMNAFASIDESDDSLVNLGL